VGGVAVVAEDRGESAVVIDKKENNDCEKTKPWKK
jgi:hypothetical protein